MSANEFKTDLMSLEPYILGNKFTGEVKKDIVRYDEDVLQKFLTMLEEDSIAKSFFEAYELDTDFYQTMVDFRKIIPKELQREVFYAAKNGVMYKEIPSFCVYLVKKAWDESYGIPNLIIKKLPTNALQNFFNKGYFLGGLTLKDVICNVCTEEYTPLSLYKNKNKLSKFTELYIPSADMVAAVPHSIGDALNEDAVNSIKVTPNGLVSGNVLLRTMCGYVGAINSIYDLRELL